MPCLVPICNAYVIRVVSSGPSILLGYVTEMSAWLRNGGERRKNSASEASRGL